MKYLYPLLLVLIMTQVKAQDLHFTQNHFAHVYFNPAQAGAFNGTYRLQALYRDQNRAFFGTKYQTPIINVDSPFMWGFKPNHWVGGGLTMFRDEAGVHSYTSTGMMANLAYHIGLDKSLRRSLGIGIRYGFINRKIDGDQEGWFADEIYSGAKFLQKRNSTDREPIRNASVNYSTLSAGLLFKTPIGKRSSLELGASGNHLLPVAYDFERGKNEIDIRFNAHAKLNATLGSRFALAPTVYFSNQGPANNIVMQLNSALWLNPPKKAKRGRSAGPPKKASPTYLYTGVGYRVGDALQAMLGMQVKGVVVSAAYDFAIGDYSDFTRQGGFEIGIEYRINKEKKPDIVPAIFCPRI